MNYDKDDETFKSNGKLMNHEILYSDIKNTKYNMRQSVNSNNNKQNYPYNINNNTQNENEKVINQFDIAKNINNDKSDNLNNKLEKQNNEIIQENIYQNSSNNKENENKNVGSINNNKKEKNGNKKENITKSQSTNSFKQIIPKTNLIKNKTLKDKKQKINNIPKNPRKSGKDKTDFTSYTTIVMKKAVEKPKNRMILGKRNNSQKNIYANNVFDNYYQSNSNNKNNSLNNSNIKSRENSSNAKREIKYEYQHQNIGEISKFPYQQFEPIKRKSKPKDPLFSKYEMLGGTNTYPVKKNNSLTKNHQKIFTIDISDIQSFYKATTYVSIANNNKKMNKDKNNLKINYDKKNYFSYINNMKRENPFEGPSPYEKKPKERKNYIAKQVKKGENEFNDITQFEDMIYSKVKIKEDELNQLIIHFIDILYKDVDKILNNKDGFKSYNYKINRIANMIIFMKNVDQIKIMEALKRTADSYNKMEIFKKLNNEIDEINKFRKTKGYKHERISNSKEGYSNRYKNSRSIQNSLK
jgi:hypothetical protein